MRYGITAPCYKCKDRVVKCHNTCIRYKEFKKLNDARRDESHKRQEAELCYWEHYFKN